MTPQTQKGSTRRMTRNSNPDDVPRRLLVDDSAPKAATAAAVDRQMSAPVESTPSGGRDEGGGDGDDGAASTMTASLKKLSNKRKTTLNTVTSKKAAAPKKTARIQGTAEQAQAQAQAPAQAGPSSTMIKYPDQSLPLATSTNSANTHRATSLQAIDEVDANARARACDQNEMPTSDSELTSSDDSNDEPYLPSRKRGPSGATWASKRRRKPAGPIKTNQKSHVEQRTESKSVISRFDHSSTRALGSFPALQSLTENVEAVLHSARTRTHFGRRLQSESHQRLKASIEVLPDPPQRAVLALLLNRYTSFCETQDVNLPAFPLSQPAKVAIFLARATDTSFGESLRRRLPQPLTYPLPIAGGGDQGSLLGPSEGSRVDVALMRCWLQALSYAQGAIAPVWAPVLSPLDPSLASIERDPAIMDIVATFHEPEARESSSYRAKSTAVGSRRSGGTRQTSQVAAVPVDLAKRRQDLQAAGAKTAQRTSAMKSLSKAISEHNARAARRGSMSIQRPCDATSLMPSIVPHPATGYDAPTAEMSHRTQNMPVGIGPSMPWPHGTRTPSSSNAPRPWPLSTYGSIPSPPLPIGPETFIRHHACKTPPTQPGSTYPIPLTRSTSYEPHLRSASAAFSLSDFQSMAGEAVQPASTPHLSERLRSEQNGMQSTSVGSQFDFRQEAAPTARAPIHQGNPSQARGQRWSRPPRIGMLQSGPKGYEVGAQNLGPGILQPIDSNGEITFGAVSSSPSMMPPPASTSLSVSARRDSQVQSTPQRPSSSTATVLQEGLFVSPTIPVLHGNGSQFEMESSMRWDALPSAPTLIALAADVRPVGWFIEADTMRTIQIGAPHTTTSPPSSATIPRGVINAQGPSTLGNPYFSMPVARPPPVRPNESPESAVVEPQPIAELPGDTVMGAHANDSQNMDGTVDRMSRPSSAAGSAPPEQHRSSSHAGVGVAAGLEGTFLLGTSATPSTSSPQNGQNSSKLISATPLNRYEPHTHLDPVSPSNMRPTDSPIYRESPLSLKEVSRAHST
ncbi:BZ3500_MvSof-1268-A1-R1_Chr4-1g06666 [Microbotryum saponariae]|uniref:BZ3500_MvSof-1268-A1-R1_Chr4-1g06666 protein n=1 Tax=Microbotryum saponariae TaxID=289078 RepID=A0A2X0LKP7_9BASI|nr:BZ3500_MvSof-1268-A1-R1_Chr4-1g06666 [Microbotryum saponariae]SDA06331.1 BZ3501_MvSof-1269-A2-R1_Chr4-1g06376 [Microbotryum saponariae]